MADWYLSKQTRELLIALPKSDRRMLVRDLGGFGLRDDDLPRSCNPFEWVYNFDNQCALRGINEAEVALWLASQGYETAGAPPPADIPQNSSRSVECVAGDDLGAVRQLISKLEIKLDALAAEQQLMERSLQLGLAETRSSIVAEVIARDALHAPGRETLEGRAVELPYHAFYCYNSKDHGIVSEIRGLLSLRDVRGWIDRSGMAPGDVINDVIEKEIKTCGAAVVFLGKKGVGKYQQSEIEAILKMDGLRVIPCLLPGFKWPRATNMRRKYELLLLTSRIVVRLTKYPDLKYMAREANANIYEREGAQAALEQLLQQLVGGILKGCEITTENLGRTWEAVVSYNFRDRYIVSFIVDELIRRGVRVWCERSTHLSDHKMYEQAKNATSTCGRAIVFLGPEGLDSFQEREIEAFARSPGKIRLIPCILPGGDLNRLMNLNRNEHVLLGKNSVNFTDLTSLGGQEGTEQRFNTGLDVLFKKLIREIRLGTAGSLKLSGR